MCAYLDNNHMFGGLCSSQLNLSSLFDHEWRDLQKDNNKAVVTKLEGLRVTLESECRP